MSRALVLGGGGTLGVAWELGVAAGLLDQNVDLTRADRLVGTSAGSIVGAVLAAGVDPRQLLAFQLAMGAAPSHNLGPQDPDTLQAVAAKWQSAAEMTPDLQREIGALALAARTVEEAVWVTSLEQILGGQPDWPARPLTVTGVDAASGEFVPWTRDSGVPLHLAVAASCTVPGLFPPVTINGRRYMDGGVRSGTNADLAAGAASVVVIAPMGSPSHPLGHRQLEREASALRAAGSTVALIVPDPESLEAFGPNLMDPSRIEAAAHAGVRQGKENAARLQAIWAHHPDPQDSHCG